MLLVLMGGLRSNAKLEPCVTGHYTWLERHDGQCYVVTVLSDQIIT